MTAHGGPRAAKPENSLLVWVLVVLVAVAGAVAIISFKAISGGHSSGRGLPGDAHGTNETPPAALSTLAIPEFTLIDQDGIVRTREMFKGRATILAFTFTNCPTACPIMNSHLIRMQGLLAGTPVRTVSISVDPAHDSPAALKAHAEKLGVDTSRWIFLTGDSAEVRRILAGLRLGLDMDNASPISLPDGSTMANILHPTKLLLVGPDVSVIGIDTGLEWSGAERVAKRAKGVGAGPVPAR